MAFTQFQKALQSSASCCWSSPLPREFLPTNAALFDVSDVSFSFVDTPAFISGSVVVLTNGGVQFGLTAPGAATATVLVSTNLTTWQPLQSLLLTNGIGVFTDNAATNFASRFYRLSVP